ncbi:hypothetical protein [Corallococcus macrosporus]|uniref:hypothetical protein n=1 Tax=Corallococcus macrosporus TaxID=35 RepID=UPI001EE64F42|nr:hypothetical protein [Corallococcus macrosporus]
MRPGGVAPLASQFVAQGPQRFPDARRGVRRGALLGAFPVQLRQQAMPGQRVDGALVALLPQ